MNNFQLPEDLSALSGEELSGLLDTAKAEFNSLYESEDVSNETLEAMEQIANAVEDIVAEKDRRTSAAAKREELSAKAAVVAQVEVAPVVEAEEVVEAAVEVAEEVITEPVVEETAPVVEAAVEATEPVESTETTDSEEGLVAASKPNTSIEIPERAPQVLIAAAVDVPQFYVGQRLDPNTLADALHNKARMLSDSRGAQTVYPVATIERPFGEGYDLEGLDQAAAWDAIAEGSKPTALTASGGWCAPSQIVYDLFEAECETGADALFSLPTFRVTRGGIRWPVYIPHDPAFNPGFVWTEANDIAATSGTPTKPCVSIPCPTFAECRLDATGLCVTAGNLMDRAYPEQVRWFLNRAIRAYERNNSIRQLNLVLADTIPVAQPASFGAASALLDSLLLQAVDYRETNGLCCGQQLDLVLPCWAQDVLRSDISRQDGTFSIGNVPTNADVTRWLESVGLNVRYINYWQPIAGNPATAWPTSLQYLLGYPGSYVRFDQGRLDLGVIRDSVLNSTNDYTAVWFEEFYCVGRRGPQSRLVTVPICPSGDVGGRVAASGDAVCA
jgi:hypothetical protein